MIINENFKKMPKNYLFSEISKRVNKYVEENPNSNIIKLGIGDVTKPLPSVVIDEMQNAVDEMGKIETFHGYGPEQGYLFLREKISQVDYKARGIEINTDEIFVSDGSKCDCGNITDMFSSDVKIALCNPVYPVYADSNAIAGKAGDYDEDKSEWTNLTYLKCTKENNFIPRVKDLEGQLAPDLIYLCYPNNPTGTMAGYKDLQEWVDYANSNNSIILYDGAYEAFITEDLPRSIYEIEGAKKCAIEFRSFSKTAGFTGVRCAYTIIPNELERDNQNLNKIWARRQSTKFNAVPYITQRAAYAVYSEKGQSQVKDTINYYMENAKIIRHGLESGGVEVFGGINAPYIWIKTPDNKTSWGFFQELLESTGVIVTPGVGFGSNGEGYIRISAFGQREDVIEAVSRIKEKLNYKT